MSQRGWTALGLKNEEIVRSAKSPPRTGQMLTDAIRIAFAGWLERERLRRGKTPPAVPSGQPLLFKGNGFRNIGLFPALPGEGRGG